MKQEMSKVLLVLQSKGQVDSVMTPLLARAR
jgi:hypothetical protein